ncbi:translation initiation factor IF-2-like [Toxorhynchites rutilus septentrionalis]|uniref:translation initiation factor IF-2-like n=1 Tax=Toxorhynchites rutilus septentrionalis TaxID=329112 RepID=UPI0024792F1E|nr:translation initiation factor IF-2-like [Toxorhynchites rutilus septentrionalis]
MRTTRSLVCLCLFFLAAKADVSEILNQTPQQPAEIQSCIVLTNSAASSEPQSAKLEQATDVIPTEAAAPAEPTTVEAEATEEEEESEPEPTEQADVNTTPEVVAASNEPEPTEAPAVVEPVAAKLQLDSSHPDFQGPYHYEKPKVQLDYGTPAEEEVVAEVNISPKVQNEYLPPATDLEAPVVAKRHAKFLGGRF